MAKSSNNLVNPNAREAMNRFKMEAASEVDVPNPLNFTHITIFEAIRLVSAAYFIVRHNQTGHFPPPILQEVFYYKAEYKIRSVTYKVERTFVGTKEASDLVRERIIRAGRKACTETAPAFSVYQKTNVKIS